MLMNTVRWADGTYDRKRVCDECGNPLCERPAYKDFYKEISSKRLRDWEKENEQTEEL